MPAWYDDWQLSIGRASECGSFVRVDLPHHKGQPVTYVTGSTVEMKHLANLLDKLLCELTGTKPNERITTAHPRRAESAES